MIDAGNGGSIVITGSTLGLRAVANMAHYVSAKHGLTGLTRGLALELAPHGIRVNSVNPTNVDTVMIQNSSVRRLFVPDIEEPTREQAEPYYAAINAMPVPWVEPQDVTEAVLFLATDASRYVTGQALTVDAGFAIL